VRRFWIGVLVGLLGKRLLIEFARAFEQEARVGVWRPPDEGVWRDR